MCINIMHFGGVSEFNRILIKAGELYTINTLYSALLTDTGNQVGAYRQRNLHVYKWIMDAGLSAKK